MPLVNALPSNLNHIHIMGIGGTAMAALAGILVDEGYKVTGSDGNVVYPPMSDVLDRIGIDPMVGYKAENLSPRPDLVVVGNVIRSTYEEATALMSSDIPYMSLPALIGDAFIGDKKSIVLTGTHGKTTTTAIAAWLLEAANRNPGFLIGGLTGNFDKTARSSKGDFFVIEGDEYDTAFFDKGPKFLHYRPTTAILTSVEFDHADIYRDLAHCQEAFIKLAKSIPASGCLVARWDHDSVVECAQHAKSEIRRYGKGQQWDGTIEKIDPEKGTMTFAVTFNGKKYGEFESIMVGEHNLYNQVAIVAALDFNGISADEMATGFQSFKGIKRRQEIIGTPCDVTVIDDFAHHPTAVKLTLEALKIRFGGRRLWAIFEPRSATSRRNTLQADYEQAFNAADIVVIAPAFNQANIPIEERLDVTELCEGICQNGVEAFQWGSAPKDTPWTPDQSASAIAQQIAANVMPHDVVAILSNGGFGGIHHKLIQAIEMCKKQ